MRPHANPVWMAVLVLALLFAQSLGQWHGTVYGGHGGEDGHGVHVDHVSVAPQDVWRVAKPSTAAASAPTLSFESLFGNHHEGADCQLFDQLCHGDALAIATVLALPLGVPAAHTAYLTGLAVARWTALFQARAPPIFR